jgi:hypothetical protein
VIDPLDEAGAVSWDKAIGRGGGRSYGWLGIIERAMKILALAFVLAVAGCAHDDRLPEQSAAVTTQIRGWIPVGTSLSDARRIMEHHHFTCSMMTNSSFGDLKGADFLYCDRRDSDSRITPIVVRRWQVALVLSDGRVSDIRVSTGLIGP